MPVKATSITARIVRVEIDVHPLDQSVVIEIEHAAETAAGCLAAIPRSARAIRSERRPFDDDLVATAGVFELIAMMRRLVARGPETRGELHQIIPPATDPVFGEIEFEVRRKELDREPSAVEVLEISLGGFDEAR